MTTPATIALVRFREPDINVLPSDDTGNLGDLNINTGLALPPVVNAFTGFGRTFGTGLGIVGFDVVAGSTLATRDVTVRCLITWDIAAQAAAAELGTIVARGGAKGAGAAEYTAYGVELRVVNAGLGIGEIRFFWQDTAGAVHTQLGGQFLAPPAGTFMMLTAVRHWVSSTSVELRYYAGDRLIGEFLSSDGDVGGGTTGSFCVGTRYGGGAVPASFLHATLDELQVLNYELTAEEVAATWNRISVLQPRGYRAVRDLMQPGAPITNDPGSRIQKLLRLAGHVLGYAAAQVENVRQNLLPDRAYGPTLAQWESIVGEAPKAPDSAPTRRKRVVAHFQQRAGSSVPGVTTAVADLLALNKSQLQVVAFDQTTRDDFSAGLNASRWVASPAAQWTIAAAALRVQNAASIPFDGANQLWDTAFQALGGEGRASRILAKLVPTTVAPGAEVGVAFFNWMTGDAILLGMRNVAGTYEVVTETFRLWVSQGVTVQLASLGGLPAALWLHLFQVDPGGSGSGFHTNAQLANYSVAWSTTSQTAGYTTVTGIQHKVAHQWAGCYARTIGGAANIDSKFDDVLVRAFFGDRSFRWYVFRSPSLPGVPDITAAHGAIQRLKQAQTAASVYTTASLLCDDVNSVCDRGPMGAL